MSRAVLLITGRLTLCMAFPPSVLPATFNVSVLDAARDRGRVLFDKSRSVGFRSGLACGRGPGKGYPGFWGEDALIADHGGARTWAYRPGPGHAGRAAAFPVREIPYAMNDLSVLLASRPDLVSWPEHGGTWTMGESVLKFAPWDGRNPVRGQPDLWWYEW